MDFVGRLLIGPFKIGPSRIGVVVGLVLTWTLFACGPGMRSFDRSRLTSPTSTTLPAGPIQFADPFSSSTGSQSGVLWNPAESGFGTDTTQAFDLGDIVSSSGLLLYLKLDEMAGATTFADSSSSGISWGFACASCPTSGVSGKVGSAISTAGAGQSIQDLIGAPNLNGLTSITIMAWVRASSIDSD